MTQTEYVSLVNPKLPAAVCIGASPLLAHAVVLLKLHSGVVLKLVYIISLSGSLAFKCKAKERAGRFSFLSLFCAHLLVHHEEHLQ